METIYTTLNVLDWYRAEFGGRNYHFIDYKENRETMDIHFKIRHLEKSEMVDVHHVVNMRNGEITGFTGGNWEQVNLVDLGKLKKKRKLEELKESLIEKYKTLSDDLDMVITEEEFNDIVFLLDNNLSDESMVTIKATTTSEEIYELIAC